MLTPYDRNSFPYSRHRSYVVYLPSISVEANSGGQHLRIKRFLATSENAVKTQIWCAIATYVLIAIIKKELKLDASLYTCLQILSVSVFEKTEISCALQHPLLPSDTACHPNQLILFEI
jgi:hypothetical protein